MFRTVAAVYMYMLFCADGEENYSISSLQLITCWNIPSAEVFGTGEETYRDKVTESCSAYLDEFVAMKLVPYNRQYRSIPGQEAVNNLEGNK